MFRRVVAHETILAAKKPFCAGDANFRKPRMVIKSPRAGQTAPLSGDRQMRTLSFIVAFAFFLVGPSMAGSSENGLPGIGTFSYNGSPVVTDAPQLMVVATR
jgi:hypothetical protein